MEDAVPLAVVILTLLYYAAFGIMMGAAEELRKISGDLSETTTWILALFWYLPAQAGVLALLFALALTRRAELTLMIVAILAVTGGVAVAGSALTWFRDPMHFLLLAQVGVSGLCSDANDFTLDMPSEATVNPEVKLCWIVFHSWLGACICLLLVAAAELVFGFVCVGVWQQIYQDRRSTVSGFVFTSVHADPDSARWEATTRWWRR